MADQAQSAEVDLHEVALAAEKNLEALATGLGQAGASPQTVKAVTQMAEVTRQIVAALGKGSSTAPDEPAPAEHEEAPSNPHGSYDQAAAETHEAMTSAAAKRK